MQREHVPALQAGFIEIDGFVHKLISDRRCGKRLRPERDLLDELLQAIDGGGLSERELCDLIVFLFVAGFDTSKKMMPLIMNFMIRPEESREGNECVSKGRSGWAPHN